MNLLVENRGTSSLDGLLFLDFGYTCDNSCDLIWVRVVGAEPAGSAKLTAILE